MALEGQMNGEDSDGRRTSTSRVRVHAASAPIAKKMSRASSEDVLVDT